MRKPVVAYSSPMDWSLRYCSWHGHETYAPDETALRARLMVMTALGEAWRCLRCGDFVPGSPRRSGPADHAPEVPHGRLLRDRWIMRALAVERWLRSVVLLAGAYAVLHLSFAREQAQRAFETDLPLLKPLAEQLGWNLGTSKVLHGISTVLGLSSAAMRWIALAVLVYAALQIIEGVGLWQVKRWGEYFAVVATSVFLPLEVYELTERVTPLKIAALVVNVIAVLWLVWSKRLFGVRGGAAAYHAEHSAESLLTVERATAGV
ncbi:Protein of unknown function DUF2068, transmembrane [Segniliparus rotundus DSM 44985]|uniref:DUF2127 domain-containing protein n=2 Tax=Segniliparus rotundus TaxID=286802 RepID=D6ZC88_SEGRD|nr:Protein of unknown function DUF2068, transmembrane [Segniliparus rotundus DSM 44985]